MADLPVEGPGAGKEGGDVIDPRHWRDCRVGPRLPRRDERHADGSPSVPAQNLRELVLVHLPPRPALLPESSQTSREHPTRFLVIHPRTSVHLKFSRYFTEV